nr:LysR family transcriptional regulator [Planosporangium thailandense]
MRWFLALAKTEQVTAAAHELYLSQPTLSRALARLERELGAPLFDRDGRRLRLNQYGRILREHAGRALAELDTARRRIDALTDPDTGLVRLAFLHSFGAWLVPDLLREYRARAPRVRFALSQDVAEVVVASLREGHADLALTSPRPDGDDLAWHPVHSERLCLAVPPDHPLATQRRVPLASVAAEPFIVLRADTGLRRITDQLCRDAGFEPTVALDSSDLQTVRALVGAGLGIAIVPEPHAPEPHATDEPAGPAYLTLTDAGAGRTIGLCWVAQRPLSPPVVAFRDHVEGWARLSLPR